MTAGLTLSSGASRRTSAGALRPRHVLLALWWWDERLLRGIAQHGAGQGWILDTRVRFANRLPIRRKYDGVIVFSGRDTTLQRMARAIHCPIVNLDQHRPVPAPAAYTARIRRWGRLQRNICWPAGWNA